MRPRYHGSTRQYRVARAHVLRYATHCYLCGQPPRPNDPLVTDHVLPRALGGADIVSNLRACHRNCNAKKGAKPLTPSFTGKPVRNQPVTAQWL